MKRHYLKAIAVFLLICSLTFIIFIKINNAFGVLNHGETYPDNENNIYSLADYHWDSNNHTFFIDLVRENEEQQLELIYAKLPSDISINGTILNKVSSSFSRVLINPDWFKDNKVRVVFNTNINPRHTPVYLTTTSGASAALSAYDMVFAFNLGITFLMSIYGISLYRLKKTEKYLLWFAIYAGALTLWSALPLFIGSGFKLIRYYAYNWCTILNIVICFKMFDINLPRYFNILLSKWGVVGVLVVWSVLETIFPILHSEICNYSLFIFSIGALIYACANKRKGAWLVLSGHAISQGMRMVMALPYLIRIDVSFLLRSMQYSKLFNLPFAFCCMLLINRLFAEKFTEAEVLAKELEQINHNLDKKVLEGTKALEEQHKRRHNFMMNIFHDLRTPLFVIQGSTQKIANRPELLNEELPIISERLDFTKHLVEDLFLMAKLEDKQVILETEKVPLTDLLKNIISACSLEGESKGICIKTELKCDYITWGDEYRLKQAFQNLLLNAIYYTKASGHIYITSRKQKNFAVISFEDTGIGIAPQDIDKIFDRYYRISGSGKHQSTGLGLSIANEIIQQHHGSISVESKVGYGTIFTVNLPIIS
ncbi:alkaline phosphatase synthesis sensor protein PhoR [Oxobacter pfennigii]|uniref:histidine kinase n=1 Tax=Oxobacter pfennigii TaxID=36849 RepID=A0A0P8W572_9CLOT|nr:HAMP domain-containing sensor histidine kinase [Oxobacter pfennigii]KPU43759.1 alkaline phosphatase synthesis sensor protein PhoR [Oxobacter pfennigii]